MKTTTILGAVAVAAAFGAAAWSRSGAHERIDALRAELEAVKERLQPVSARSEELAELLRRSEADLERVQGDLGALADAVADQSGLLVSDRERAQVLESEIAVTRDEAQRAVTDLMRALEREIEGSAEAGEELAELALALGRLGERLESLPPGVIVPWVPSAGGVPEGWLVCDGTRGTPDLRGLFLRGAGVGDAGRYQAAAEMRPAGVHAHARDENRSLYNLSRAAPKELGDWLILFDAGVQADDPEGLAEHGYHVHEDEHVPAHFTVVFLMKEPA